MDLDTTVEVIQQLSRKGLGSDAQTLFVKKFARNMK